MEAESGRSSNKITEYSNYKSYGLFQINSKEHCKAGKKGGLCGMKCEDFLKDDIKNDIECAKTIYGQKGFDGWPGWQRKCKGKPLPDITKCERILHIFTHLHKHEKLCFCRSFIGLMCEFCDVEGHVCLECYKNRKTFKN